MASLPRNGTVTHQEWLRMAEVQDGTGEVVNGHMEIRKQPLTGGILKPKQFPGVQGDISGIWPD